MGYLAYSLELKFWSWTIAVIYTGIIGTLFLVKMRKTSSEVKSQKALYRSMAMFFYSVIGTRVFYLLSDFERDAHDKTLFHFQLVAIGYIFTILGFLSILSFGEKYILKRSKYAISITVLIFLIITTIMVFFPEYIETVRLFNYGLLYFSMGLILLLYLYLVKKMSGDLRKNALITLIGLIISSLAAFLEMDALLSTGAIPPFLSPIIFSIGITLIALGQKTI